MEIEIEMEMEMEMVDQYGDVDGTTALHKAMSNCQGETTNGYETSHVFSYLLLFQFISQNESILSIIRNKKNAQ